jgi:hypothetical protein
MASVLTSDFQKRLIEAIKEFGGCAYPGELAVRLKVDAGLVALALRQLAAGGLVYRLEESVLDFTKPLLTSKWCIAGQQKAQERPEVIGEVVDLIVNPKLYRDLGSYMQRMGFPGTFDALKGYVCSSEVSLKVMMPYIGDLLGVMLAECIERLSRVEVKVITEVDSAGSVEPIRGLLPNIKVLYATQYAQAGSRKVKVRGIHAKLILVDRRIAVVGTFNLTKHHLYTNYDIGVVLRGAVASYLDELFEAVWGFLATST